MAIYEKKGTGAVNLLEQPIYGADRLGTPCCRVPFLPVVESV